MRERLYPGTTLKEELKIVAKEKPAAKKLDELLTEKATQMELEMAKIAGKSSPRKVTFSDIDTIKHSHSDLYQGYLAMRHLRRSVIRFMRGEGTDVIASLRSNSDESAPLDGDSGVVTPAIIVDTLSLLGINNPSVDSLFNEPQSVFEGGQEGSTAPERLSLINIPTIIDGIAVNVNSFSTALPSGQINQQYELTIIPSQSYQVNS